MTISILSSSIYLILSWASLASAFRAAKFVATGFVDTMYLSNEITEPVTEDIYSAIDCGFVCSNLPSKKCTRYRFCQQEVGKPGTCMMYESGAKCIIDKQGGSCSCFMVIYIMEENGECTCPVGYYGNGDSCCKTVIIDCTEGERLPHLKGRNKLLAYVKPVGYSGDPFEVVCKFNDGGKTYISRRVNFGNLLSFNRPLIDYIQGFENDQGSFWLGFTKIFALLQNGLCRLYINLNYNGKSCTLKQDILSLETEENEFTINLNLISGEQPEWCRYFVDNINFSGMSFSTYDNDKTTSGCATMMQSGWWFDDTCNNLNLNAPYNNDTPPTITVSHGQPQLKTIVLNIVRN